MIAGTTKEDLMPLNLRVYGIYTSTLYLNMRSIVALVRAEEDFVDIDDVSISIMGDSCRHAALGQSS